MGIFGEDVAENFSQGPIFPVSFGAIPVCELGRKPNYAV
jgi:hypothetical protein